MKKILFLLSVSIILFSSCEGDQGPPGPQGEPGSIFVAETLEIDNVNFGVSNQFVERVFLDPNIGNDDVVLVYRLDRIDEGLEVWEPLPTGSIFFFNDTTGAVEGFLYYRFDFTIGDVDIILEFDVPDANLVGPEFTNNQKFRIVIIPSEQAQNLDIDLNDFNAVQSTLNLEFN